MRVLVADAYAHVHSLLSVVKMETGFGECTTEQQRSFVRFLWVKRHNEKDIHKEIFPVYGGKCLSLKAIHSWVDKFSAERSKVANNTRPEYESG
jgi:hypothetical protein